MPCIAIERREILQIAGVGQVIEVDDWLVGLGQPVKDEVTADKACCAGD